MDIENVKAIIRKLAPPFKKVDDETLEAWIEMADMLSACESKFGEDYDRAVALYTLYLITQEGVLKSESDSVEDYSQRLSSFTLSGEFSQTFASLSGSTSDSMRDNPWGKMYIIMAKKKGIGFGITTALYRGCCK